MSYKRKFVGSKGSPRKVREVYGLDMDRFKGADAACAEEDPRTVMLSVAWEFLWERERQVLLMVADGKGPSDVAAVFGLNSKQHAKKEIDRTRRAARFYCENAGTILNVVKLGPLGEKVLTSDEVKLVCLLVIERRTYEDAGQAFGKGTSDGAKTWVRRSVKSVVSKLVEAGKRETADMLVKFAALRPLRSRRRRIMTVDSWRSDFMDTIRLLSEKGVWYVWGGQDPFKRPYGVADCSGLVIEVLRKLGRVPQTFPDMTVTGLAKEFNTTENPKPGDLAFYGRKTVDGIKYAHIMFYVGEYEVDGKKFTEAVVGMGGGGKDMTLAQARAVGAGMWFRSSPRYRRDFLFFRRVP